MRFSKINRIIKNPEIFGLYIKTRNKRAVKNYVLIKETRNLMLKACDLVDELLNQNKEIKDIIDFVSSELHLTKYPIAWYALIRKFDPKIIVETGTSMGWSSFMILNAFKREKEGHLYSFDLDDSESVKKDGGVGYLVPDYLKKNWTLIIGDTKTQLKPFLQKLGQIDMFIHDSEHSYDTMMFEYSLAWKFLKNNGILCSDDINHSKAFDEFITIHKNEIVNLNKFQEIKRSSDHENLRPWVGYFLKIS